MWHRQLSFTDWSCKELVVDLARWIPTGAIEADYAEIYLPLLFTTVRYMSYLGNIERIELRFPQELETRLRDEMQKTRQEQPNNPVRERLLPLMIMVGSDGKERKLLDMIQ